LKICPYEKLRNMRQRIIRSTLSSWNWVPILKMSSHQTHPSWMTFSAFSAFYHL
jgi:hypothetical protein